jgi:hypothetical protein
MDFLFWISDACGCDCGFFVVICLKDLWWVVDCCGWRRWWPVEDVVASVFFTVKYFSEHFRNATKHRKTNHFS